MLLKPQRDLEQVGKRNQGSFQIPLISKIVDIRLCALTLSVHSYVALGRWRLLSLGEKWLRIITKVKGQRMDI